MQLIKNTVDVCFCPVVASGSLQRPMNNKSTLPHYAQVLSSACPPSFPRRRRRGTSRSDRICIISDQIFAFPGSPAREWIFIRVLSVVSWGHSLPDRVRVSLEVARLRRKGTGSRKFQRHFCSALRNDFWEYSLAAERFRDSFVLCKPGTIHGSAGFAVKQLLRAMFLSIFRINVRLR